jgi:hypothetical protein
MRTVLLFVTAGLFSAASLLASCSDSPPLGLLSVDTPDAGVDAADAADEAPPVPSPPRVIQVAAWPGRGLQIAIELDPKSAGSPDAWIEPPSGLTVPANVAKPDAQPGITAVLVVPAADKSAHAERLTAAAALINALPAGESVILLVARAEPVLLAERSVDRAHAGKRLLEIAPEAGRSAAAVIDPARELLADCGGKAGPLYRSLVVVGDAAADDPPLAVSQTFAMKETGSPGPAATKVIAEMAARRAAIVRIGACPGLDADAPIKLHVGDSITELIAPEPMDHLLTASCDPDAAARDDYPFPSEINLSFTAAERAVYDQLYATSSNELFTTSVTLGLGAPIPTEAHFHGAGSLACERKSITIHLDGPRRRLMPEVADDRFFLISMCLDNRYFGQVWGERLMASLGLFPSRLRYVRLRIDGENKGVYLMVQRPEDVLRTDDAGVVSVIRRRYDIKGEPAEVKYPDEPPASDAALATYNELASIATTAPVADIAPQLDARMDLDAYLRWVALNSLLHNGDYIDEAFFYASAEDNAWFHRVMGWDLDDLFEDCHAGGADAIADPCGLTYCMEAQIDQALVRSPEVYQRYLVALGAVLEALPPEKLASTMNAVRDDLWDVLDDDETSAALTEMVKENPGAVSLSVARADIGSHMDTMLAAAVARHAQLKNKLATCAP